MCVRLYVEFDITLNNAPHYGTELVEKRVSATYNLKSFNGSRNGNPILNHRICFGE